MPHSLFLGSALATQDRAAPESARSEREAQPDGASATDADTGTDIDNGTDLPAPAPIAAQSPSRLAALRRLKPALSVKALKDGAREAFVRCVTIDDEDGESWNNLASVYMRMGEAGKTVPLDDEDCDGAGQVSITKL